MEREVVMSQGFGLSPVLRPEEWLASRRPNFFRRCPNAMLATAQTGSVRRSMLASGSEGVRSLPCGGLGSLDKN